MNKFYIIIGAIAVISGAILGYNFLQEENLGSGGATCTWDPVGASTDMNDVNNYTGASCTLDSSDNLVFNAGATSSTATAPIEVASITTTSGYSGAWSISGQTASTSGNMTFDGTGTLNLGNGLTLNGASATLHIGSGSGAVTASNCNLIMNGTTGMIIDDDKAAAFLSLTLGASAVVTNSGWQTTSYIGTAPLTFTNGGSLTINRSVLFRITATGNIVTITAGTPTIAGNSLITFTTANGLTATLPTITFGGTVNLEINILTTTSANGTFTLGGNLTMNGGLKVGANASGRTLNFNAGSGTHSIGSFSNNNTGTTNINLDGSSWSVAGNWAYGSNHTVDAGTSQITFTNTATVTANGLSFYNLIVNADTKTVTLGAAFVASGTLTVTAGSFNDGGYATTLAGDFAWNSTGTLTLSGDFTLSGNGTITISNSGTITTTASDWILLGDNTLTINKATTINSLSCSYTGKTTTTGGTANFAVIGNTPTVTFNSGAIVTNYNFLCYGKTTGNLWTGTFSSWTGGSTVQFGAYSTTGQTITIPAITATINLAIWNAYAVTSVVNLGGAVNITGTFRVSMGNAAGELTFNSGNFPITVSSSFSVGGWSASSVSTFNWGSSIISIGSFANTTTQFNGGTQTHNLQTSQWSVGGSWSWGDNAGTTVSPGSSLVTFTNTATITSASKKFYQVNINASGKTITLADNLTVGGCNLFNVLAGTMSYGAFGVLGNECGGIYPSFINFP